MRFSWQAQLRGPQEEAVRKQLLTAQSRAPSFHDLGALFPDAASPERSHKSSQPSAHMSTHCPGRGEDRGADRSPTDFIRYVEEWSVSVFLHPVSATLHIWCITKSKAELVFLQNEEICLIRFQRLKLSVHSSQSTFKLQPHVEW